jgi:hypothetical protein
MKNLEKFDPIEEQENREKNAEKLEKVLEEISKDIENKEVPVNKECRIDMQVFGEIYDLKKDEEEINRLEIEYAKKAGLPLEKWKENKNKTDGEQLEMLKTIIFHKNLSSDFVVTRSSRFDDIKNNVDNVIINKKTGSVICAFDEGTPRKGDEYEEKQKAILERDKKGGVDLKYGVKFEGDIKKPTLGRLNKLPIFHLALHPSEVQKGIEALGNEDIEKALFKVFITEIDSQIKKIESESTEIHPHLQKQWSDFREFIKDEL